MNAPLGAGSSAPQGSCGRVLDFFIIPMQIVWRFLLVLFLAQFAHAAAQPTPARKPHAASPVPPNVILITLDTTRADRMGFLGSERGLTPNLDALAQHSIVFTR